MAGAKSRKRRNQDTREEILRAAEQIIARKGMEGFQLKEVALAVGIKPPSIFAHFAGREAIAQAVSEKLLKGIAELITIKEDEDPVESLRRWVRDLVAYFYKNPAHIRIAIRDLGRVGSPGLSSFESTQQLLYQIRDQAEALLRDGQDAGIFREVRASSLVAQLYGAIIANLAWAGWDDAGNPILEVPLKRIQLEAEELAIEFVIRRD